MPDAPQNPSYSELVAIVGEYVERLELMADFNDPDDQYQARANELERLLTTPELYLELEHERGFESGYSAAVHDARVPGSRAHSELEPLGFIRAARDLNENLPDSLPITDNIRTRADAEDVLRIFREHCDALEQARAEEIEAELERQGGNA